MVREALCGLNGGWGGEGGINEGGERFNEGKDEQHSKNEGYYERMKLRVKREKRRMRN